MHRFRRKRSAGRRKGKIRFSHRAKDPRGERGLGQTNHEKVNRLERVHRELQLFALLADASNPSRERVQKEGDVGPYFGRFFLDIGDVFSKPRDECARVRRASAEPSAEGNPLLNADGEIVAQGLGKHLTDLTDDIFGFLRKRHANGRVPCPFHENARLIGLRFDFNLVHQVDRPKEAFQSMEPVSPPAHDPKA